MDDACITAGTVPGFQGQKLRDGTGGLAMGYFWTKPVVRNTPKRAIDRI